MTREEVEAENARIVAKVDADMQRAIDASRARDLPEDFANHPKSIAEIRSDKDWNAAKWTPRDVLIDLLRDIDAGHATPTALVVAWCTINGDTSSSHYSVSSPNAMVTLGLVERARHRMNWTMDQTSE